MIEVSTAQNIILDNVDTTSESEFVDISDSFGRVLAENVLSKEPLPSFRASMKDGYAVLSDDIQLPYTVVGRSDAGNAVCKLI